MKEIIAVDLDGTLAHYDYWRGIEHIGEPVPLMMERVQEWIAEGKEVVIFTARITPFPDEPLPDSVSRKKAVRTIKRWLRAQGLPDLEITNVKRQNFSVFYDDRAIQVQPNTGRIINRHDEPSE